MNELASEESSQEKLETLSFSREKGEDDVICSVTIQCKAPSDDGKMEVEMFYEGGDEALASYLVETARETLQKESH